MKKSVKEELFSWMKSLLVAFLIVFICEQLIITPKMVSGESMEPTYENKDRVIISKVSTPKRFDIITFHAPYSNHIYIKRIIGLPGDHLQMIDDQLYINNRLVKEPYLAPLKAAIGFGDLLTGNFDAIVPKGHYFVLGDNRQKSNDSLLFGPIHEKSLIGVVKFTYYPLDHAGFNK
ncbi:signal peptidase I [Bacillus sp. 1P06AnD]|uniref:signal peptidase I n=1 Tax=Bacillus sp. 1P06AnD TaxID=3132208 RepID=UPI00399F559A